MYVYGSVCLGEQTWFWSTFDEQQICFEWSIHWWNN